MTNAVSLLPSTAVVVAHGPTGATLTALNRVPGLIASGGRVVVIAGTEPGMTAVERASERGYGAVEDHGPEALVRLLSSLEGPVLVLHDDVTVSAHSVAGMTFTHARTRVPVVPGTGRRCQQRRLDEAELSCVVGDAADLARLAATSSFGPGVVAKGRFVSAPDSEASHVGECRSRLVDTWGQPARPLLVAALIVRDEAEYLADCLTSLDGVVDRIEVADTGSMDDTVAIARAHGANVTEIEWRDDFAWARNQVLERCRDASYMLWIDADERLVCPDPDRLRRTLGTFERLYPSYRIEIRNLTDGRETHRFAAMRIAATQEVAFDGALHERLRRTDRRDVLEVGLTQCHIDHVGYGRAVMDEREKNERNLAIAAHAFEAEPTPERAVHYARALMAASTDADDTLLALEPLLALAQEMPEAARAMLLGLRAKLLLDAGRLEQAEADAGEAVRLVPADAIAAAGLAEALVRLGRPQEALDRVSPLRQMPSAAPMIVDHVASETCARALFDAALAVESSAAAVAQLPMLARAFDPWTALGERFGTNALLEQARTAGELNDDRLLRALGTRPDVTADQMTAALDRFLDAGGSLLEDELVEDTIADLRTVDSAASLREEFVASGDVVAAVQYARALATGHLDLTLEADDAQEHEHGVAIALSVAAEALRRRDRHEEATAEAIEAAQLWPGALRAAAIVARAAIENGMPEVALDMVAAARETEADRNVSGTRRDELTNCAVAAHLALSDLPSAVGEALVIIENRGHLESWPTMLEATIEDTEKLTLVLGLALLSDGTDFLAAAAATLRPDKTAELCLAYVMSGGRHPDAITTGILAALLRGRIDLAELLADHADRLDPDVRVKLIRQAGEAGAASVRLRLEQGSGSVAASSVEKPGLSLPGRS